ncbi:hypothetical protein VTN00DRAFT_3523 [Thermoascus crustaceus]|uniref:uncharacterized protein n=1 Tax=Thermoascus crustaceus TaxID=5088 RepID=UPI003742277E
MEKLKSRRIPDELRKRTRLSCDLCRKRRCKCLRPRPDDACQACRQSRVACVSTFRRKTRLYGSVETLRDRLRCLEALVQGAFPDAPIRTTDDLLALGRRAGYAMPEVSASSGDTTLEELPEEPESPLERPEEASPGVSTPAAAQQDLPWQGKHIQDSPRLVHDSSGRSHYIGPSGSLSFFAELRELVAERHPSSRFASDNVAEALEARPSTSDLDHDSNSPGVAAGSSPATASLCDISHSALRLRELPLGTVEALLHVYFQHVHNDFPLFHRTLFQDELERHLSSDSRPRSAPGEPDEGWLVCLHMMLVFGCILHSRSSKRTDSFDYEALRVDCWSVARSALPRLTTTCTQSNVQALLLISLYYHSTNERNASWTLVGCAARIAVALGMHRNDINTSFRLVERETRRRIWCTLHGFEQFLCMSLGRPSAVDDDEVDVTVPGDDSIGFGSGPPGCVERSFELQLLSSKLRRAIGRYKPMRRSRSSPVQTPAPRALLDELRTWEQGMPPHLTLPDISTSEEAPPVSQLRECQSRYPAPHLRAIALLYIQYYNLVILITRPYLLMVISTSFRNAAAIPYPWDDDTDETRDDIVFLARTCVSSASRIAALVLLLDSAGILNGLTWLDAFYAYSAAMVLLLRLLWVSNPAEDRDVLQREEVLRSRAQNLVVELRRVLGALEKCQTMQRFTSVVDNFADAVSSASARVQRADATNEASQFTPRLPASGEHMEKAATGGRKQGSTPRPISNTRHAARHSGRRSLRVYKAGRDRHPAINAYASVTDPSMDSHSPPNAASDPPARTERARYSTGVPPDDRYQGPFAGRTAPGAGNRLRHSYPSIDPNLYTENDPNIDIRLRTPGGPPPYDEIQEPVPCSNRTISSADMYGQAYPPPPDVDGHDDMQAQPEDVQNQIDEMPPFPDEGMSGFLWHDPSAVTQHMLYWSDFERFLGSLDGI